MSIIYQPYKELSAAQRNIAIQRLTALWAFCESGLGGIMHALQFPFTGLVVGGMAVIIISFIATLSQKKFSTILKSMLIVLIVKAAVSPHTPFPAYIAVGFQSLLGYLLFTLMNVNFFSILLLSVVCMIESAIQKLLILTLFFGNAFWKAADELANMLTKQFAFASFSGSHWLITIYLFIYFIGGILIAFVAYKTMTGPGTEQQLPMLELTRNEDLIVKRKSFRKKLFVTVSILIIISILLFALAPDKEKLWLNIIKTFCYTCTAILLWYILINPLFVKIIQRLLQKKQSAYAHEVTKVLSFMPELRQLAAVAWKKSAAHNNIKRPYFFITTFLHWSLIWAEPAEKNNSFKDNR